MAKQSTSKPTTVHRIKATDTSQGTTRAAQTTTTTTKKPTTPTTSTSSKNPVQAFVGYFRGAWAELKLVRWPTRSATWSMTVAVLAFSLLFTVIVLALDAGFNWLFEQILK